MTESTPPRIRPWSLELIVRLDDDDRAQAPDSPYTATLVHADDPDVFAAGAGIGSTAAAALADLIGMLELEPHRARALELTARELSVLRATFAAGVDALELDAERHLRETDAPDRDATARDLRATAAAARALLPRLHD